MEENTNMAEQATQAENMGAETEVQGAAGEGEKTYTQDDVTNIIQRKLSSLRKQAARESEAEYNQKLAELQARESKLMVKEALSDRNMPRELADIITCTDEDDLKAKLDALQKIYGDKAKEKEKPTGFIQVGAGPAPDNGRMPIASDPVRKAMGLE